jgi:ketopantoate reductase
MFVSPLKSPDAAAALGGVNSEAWPQNASDSAVGWFRRERAELAAAIGCPISESGTDRMAVTAKLGAFKCSMLQDVEAGRPIELQALLGAPREIALRVGIPIPQLDRIYGVTRLMAESLGIG